MDLLKKLSRAEKKLIKEAVEAELERYRIYKTTAFVRREANVTSSPEPRYHGPTNETSDQTGSIAAYNVDELRRREAFCIAVEEATSRLPEKEAFLVKERYLNLESDYVTDLGMYTFKFDPPISEGTYVKIRDRSMLKLALILRVKCGVDFNALFREGG